VEFRLLGPLEVQEGDNTLQLGGPKQRTVLALLLLRAGEVVSVDALTDALWGDEPPRTSSTAIHNFVADLRKQLGAERLVTRAPGYLLHVGDDELDVQRVRRLATAAKGAPLQERVDLLRRAEALWRGPPLPEFAYDEFAQTAIARLEELRLAVLEDRIAAEVELGRHGDAVVELEGLVLEHPLRERLREQLMTALYRSGRQAEALGVYQDARRALVDELGLEPGRALQQLHAAILRQERSLDEPRRLAPAVATAQDVVDVLLEGRLVPVLGAETGELARRLAERFDTPPDEGNTLVRAAQYVALMRGAGPLYDELHELVGVDARPTPVHRFFAALPPLLRERGTPHQLLVTTSYDLMLERALLDAGEEFDVVSYLASGPNRGKFCHVPPDGDARVIEVPNRYATELDLARRTVVLKLHGGIDSAPERAWESFVVTEDDYIDYLPSLDLAAAVPVALAAHLRRSHFLFLGYGMRDWNLRVVLNRLWGGPTVSYRSWAVGATAGPAERAFWRARDIELQQADLEEYVAALAHGAGVENGSSA
jgi:DNA-binding SARP family transcriptional activator